MENIEEKLKNKTSKGMTDSERSSLRSHIIAFMETYQPHESVLVKSPFIHFWNPLVITMCSMVFIFTGGGAVVHSAAKSLPGDKLYNFKINVVEEVAGVLINSQKEKIIWQQNRVAKRLDEVKELAMTGELNEETVAIAEEAIEDHLTKVGEDIKEMAINDPRSMVETAEALSVIIESHEEDLEEIAKTQEEILPEEEVSVTEEVDVSSDTKIEDSVNISNTTMMMKAVGTSEIIDNSSVDVSLEANITTSAPDLSLEANTITPKKTQVSGILEKIKRESTNLEEVKKPIIQGIQDGTVKNSTIEVAPEQTIDHPTIQ